MSHVTQVVEAICDYPGCRVRTADITPDFYAEVRAPGWETWGRFQVGTAAAVVADRLPVWARETYWGTVADRYFDSALPGLPVQPKEQQQ